MRWVDSPVSQQQSVLGKMSLWRGLLCLVVSTFAWVFFLFSQVSGTYVWAGVAMFAVGNYFFHRSDVHRRRGQLRLSRTLDYSVKNDLLAREYIATARRSRHSNAQGAFFFLLAMLPYAFGLLQLVDGMKPLWRALRGEVRVLEQLPAVLSGLAWGLIGMTIAWALISVGFRKFELVVPSLTALDDSRYCLYLRPFRFDRRLRFPEGRFLAPLARGVFATQGTNTEEERLELALEWAGPTVTVGRPGESSSYLGVPRVYVSGPDWKTPVRNLMLAARLIVLVLDESESMCWEFGEAVRAIAPERLVILVRFDRLEYERVRWKVQEYLQDLEFRSGPTGAVANTVTLPDYEDSPSPARTKIKAVIYFEDEWQPRFVPLERVPYIEDQLVGPLDRAFWLPMLNLQAHEDAVR